MTDREAKRLIKRIDRLHQKWRRVLGLEGWEATGAYLQATDVEEEHPAPAAEIHVQWAYERYQIHFFLDELVDEDDEALSLIVLHELCHALIEPATPEAHSHNVLEQKLNELVTTRVANAILRASEG